MKSVRCTFVTILEVVLVDNSCLKLKLVHFWGFALDVIMIMDDRVTSMPRHTRNVTSNPRRSTGCVDLMGDRDLYNGSNQRV